MKKKEYPEIAEFTLEVEGKVAGEKVKETFVLEFNPRVDGEELDRFEIAQNPQKYIAELRSILAIAGQKTLVPKAEFEKKMADREKGIYEWLKGGAS